jgi:hypothetical protein
LIAQLIGCGSEIRSFKVDIVLAGRIRTRLNYSSFRKTGDINLGRLVHFD